MYELHRNTRTQIRDGGSADYKRHIDDCNFSSYLTVEVGMLYEVTSVFILYRQIFNPSNIASVKFCPESTERLASEHVINIASFIQTKK